MGGELSMGKTITYTAVVKEMDSIQDLTAQEQSLISKAIDAAKTAYAPYSRFNVGASVLLENGKIISGNNQENVAYPSGLCAERVALFAASANYPGVPVKAIAISAISDHVSIGELLSPCGACRQVMVEYEHRYQKNITLFLKGDTEKVYVVDSIGDILPFSFNSDKLKPK